MRLLRSLPAAALASALVLAACGGDDEPAASSGGSASDGPVTVAIQDFAFDPVEITVAAGTEVTFENLDSAAHTATARDTTTFNTENIDGGASSTISIAEPGTYEYFCAFHPVMVGTIVVE